MTRGAEQAQWAGCGKNLLGRAIPGLHPGHSHAGCWRSIQLYPSNPPIHGAEHKAPLDQSWGQLCEARAVLCGI